MEPDQINELFRTVGRIEQKQDQTLETLRSDARRISKLERQMAKLMLIISGVGTPLIWFGRKLVGLL